MWLPSGGSLVIDHTEAMTVIDVNTGKFTGQGGNLEQTVTRNNLEAAEEIVRQLRLRDLGGIIVIDFIDMVLESNRELVLRRLLECLARDRTKHQVAEVTSLGLVQMTRKRVGSGLLEAFSVPCEHCNGRGVIISVEPVDHTPARGRGDNGHGREIASTDSAGKNGRNRGGRPGPGGSAVTQGNDGTGDNGKDSEAAEDRAPGAGGSRSRGGRNRTGRSARSGHTQADGAGQLEDKAAVPDVAAQPSADGAAGVDSDSGATQPASGRSGRSRSSRSRRSGPVAVGPAGADPASQDSSSQDSSSWDSSSQDATVHAGEAGQ